MNPWKEFSSLQRQMNRFFDELSSIQPFRSSQLEADFLPACNVVETDGQYLISIEVPGIPKNAIKVEVTGDILTVSGEHQEQHQEGKGKNRIMERTKGRFERSFALPEIKNVEKIEAAYSDGVLNISVPKAEAKRSRQIQISDGKNSSTGQLSKSEDKKSTKSAENRAA